jgi:hypothetical protein
MIKDYLQDALATFNSGSWYGWKKEDDNGNVIPNSERMQYQYIKIIKDGARMPSKAEVEAKIAEFEQEEINKTNAKTSAKSKLEALGLTTEEIKALIGQ